MSKHILVTGAGGFIGGHLVAKLLQDGHRVRAVDRKPQWQWYQRFPDAENMTLNLEEKEGCRAAVSGSDWIYNLAADMGGMGFIELNKGLCMLTVLINTHMLMAARECAARRFFYSSSACVYAGFKQQRPDIPGLKEDDAYPADPEDGYGWEKLFSERMCRHFREDFRLETRVARYHNAYGPHGTFGCANRLSIHRPLVYLFSANGAAASPAWGNAPGTTPHFLAPTARLSYEPGATPQD